MKTILWTLLFFVTFTLKFANGQNSKNPSDLRSRFLDVPAENIGPTVMSGRVTDVEVNPANPIEMLVAYASGGLWYTKNNGQSFRPIFDHEKVMTIGDLAVDWKNFTIYIGSGENNSSRSSYAGNGIYKSTDTGRTWTHLGLEESHHIGRILLHPSNPKIIYTAVLGHLYTKNKERGVYKSIDGGQTWTKILFVDDKTGFIDLVFDPSDPSKLYAAAWERQREAWNFKGSGPGSGIYYTKDNGEKWTKIYDKPNTGRIGLAAYSSNGNTGIYALIDDQNLKPEEKKDSSILTVADLKALINKPVENFLGLNSTKLNNFLRSQNFPDKLDADSVKKLISHKKFTVKDLVNYTGDANSNLFNSKMYGAVIVHKKSGDNDWEIINDSIGDFYYTYGYYFGRIYLAPDNPQNLYILGVVLAHSGNGGKTFDNISQPNVHSDHHVLWINADNPDHLVNGNDGGLNISYDCGLNWVKCNSPSVGQFYAIAADEGKNYNVYGGLQDNGVWMGKRNYSAGVSWHSWGHYPYKHIMGGDGMQIQIDSKNHKIFTGFQFGNYYRLDLDKNERVYITPRHELGEFPYRFNWQTPILLSRHSENTLYLGGNFLFRSLNGGESWEKISPDLTSGMREGNVPFGTLTCIDESALKFGLLYTGSDDGNLHMSTDGGNSWKNIGVKKNAGMWVSRVKASSHSVSRVYVSFNAYRQDNFAAYLYRSEDYGKIWENISGNLPAEPVNVILEDPVNDKILYVGTDHGLYISIDGGNNWEKLTSIPYVAVHDLIIQKENNELIVGTHGRSIYVVSLEGINNTPDPLFNKEISITRPSFHKANDNWGKKYSFWEKPFEKEVMIRFGLKKDRYVELNILDSTGVIVYTKNLIGKAGLNYYSYSYKANQNLNSGQLRKGDNKEYYLRSGAYILEIKSGEISEKIKFKLMTEKN